MSRVLFSKISAVRRKQSMVTVGQGAAAAAGAAVLLLMLQIFADWAIEFSHALRAALLVIDLLLLGYIALWHMARPIVFGPDDESIALMVERNMPDFRTRLIASVQLSNPRAVPAGTSPSLVRAMIAQTEHMAQPRNFTQVVKPDSMLRTMAVAALIVLVGAASFVWASPGSKVMLKRSLLLSDEDVPRRTRVKCLTENQRVPIGDSITIQALALGEIPETGRLEMKFAKRAHKVEMQPSAEKKNLFTKTIDNVQESFSYVIRLNDGHSETYNIIAEPRPALVAVEFEQEYPAYTNHPNQKRPPGSLPLLPGSTLHAKVKTNKPVKEGTATVRSSADTKSAEITLDASDRTALTYDLKINGGTTGVSFDFVDDYGIASRGSTLFPIDIVIDQPPQVHLTWPLRREELATQQAKVLMAFEATDDFGVARASLKYKMETEDDIAARSIVLLERGDAEALQRAALQIQDAIAAQKQIADALRAMKDQGGDGVSLREEQTKLMDAISAMTPKIPASGGEAANQLKAAAEAMLLASGFIKSKRSDKAIESAAAALGSLEQAFGEADLRRVRRRHEFNLGALRPLAPEGSVIEYWVQVEDGNNITGPGIANSEHYRVKVVSEEEKRADLMNRLNDQLGSVEKVTEDQDAVSRRLGSLIQEKQ